MSDFLSETLAALEELESSIMGRTERPAFGLAALEEAVDPASHDEIAARAYEIFIARGGDDGHDQDDWLQAEGELNSRAASDVSVRGVSR